LFARSWRKPLLFPEEDPDRNTRKIKMQPELVLQVILIRLLDIVREIAEKGKRWSGRW
jgi:hypothetical protein